MVGKAVGRARHRHGSLGKAWGSAWGRFLPGVPCLEERSSSPLLKQRCLCLPTTFSKKVVCSASSRPASPSREEIPSSSEHKRVLGVAQVGKVHPPTSTQWVVALLCRQAQGNAMHGEGVCAGTRHKSVWQAGAHVICPPQRSRLFHVGLRHRLQ